MSESVKNKLYLGVIMKLKKTCFFIIVNLSVLFVITGSTPELTYALDNSTIPEMVFVPEGSFFMGQNMFGRPADDTDAVSRATDQPSTPDSEADAFTGATPFKESPAHHIFMSSYYIGKYEITNEQYAKFIDAGGYDNRDYWLIDPEYNEDAESGWNWKEENNRTCPRFIVSYRDFPFVEGGWDLNDAPYWKNTPYSNQADTPVLGVSWHEAYAYCKWLSAVTGDNYRLPTEAQWEYAARGPSSNIFPWGNKYLSASEMCGPPGSGAKANCRYSDEIKAEPVASYPEGISWCGAYNMAGNVAERTADWFNYLHYYKRLREGDVINPKGPQVATPPFFVPIFPFWVEPCRVIKSKGFNTDPMDNNNYNKYGSSYPLRSAARMFNVQYGGHYFIGFRVVRNIDQY